MQKISFFAIMALLAFSAVAEVEKDEGVLVLTDANFDEELAKHTYLLVEFYAPWCGHCKKLAPEYARAAADLANNDPPYSIAKVDATVNTELAGRFGIKGFPTLFFFKNGNKVDYTGGRTQKEIVDWVLKKTKPAYAEIGCEALRTKIDENNLVFTYFGEAAHEHFETFKKVAESEIAEKYQVFYNHEKVCADLHGAKNLPSFTVFRKFDESPVHHHEGLTAENGINFLKSSSVPSLIEFSEDYIEPIFADQKSALMLFRSNADATGHAQKIFEEASQKFKGEILFVVSDIKEGIQSRLAEFVGIGENQLPAIRILDPAAGMKKFAYEGNVHELTLDHLKTFLDDFKAGKLVAHFKSAEIPVQDKDYVEVVGKTFHQIVMDPTKEVFVKYYAPWCGHCKKLAPIWEELATETKGASDLIIAKFDATANEADGVEIRGYPTLKFYPKGENKKAIDYDGERDLESFKNWLREKSESYRHHLD
jgi:protein disulfide-isomerase A1